MPKWEALRSNNKQIALNLLPFTRFRWSMKLNETWTPKSHSKSANIGAEGAHGFYLYDLGSLLEAPVFCVLGSGKQKGGTTP